MLLEEAKKAYRARKYAEIAAKIDAAESAIGMSKSEEVLQKSVDDENQTL